jgi:4-diphosphocytidyl-2C-methyl-D-erythritol kinase
MSPEEVARRYTEKQPDAWGFWNGFSQVMGSQYPKIDVMRSDVLATGALVAGLSGSGPTFFGIYGDEVQAKSAFDDLQRKYPSTWLAIPCENGVKWRRV